MTSRISLIVMSLLYIAAGINHFVNPSFYVKIMPVYIPLHFFLVIASGVIEIILGALLLVKRTKRIAAFLVILMLVAFFSVHIQMLIDHTPNLLIAVIRFVLQFLLIAWALLFTKKSPPYS